MVFGLAFAFGKFADPFDDDVDVPMFFGGDGVDGDFPTGEFGQLELADEVAFGEGVREIVFIAEDEQRDGFESCRGQKGVQFVASGVDHFEVHRIDDVDDNIGSSTVLVPVFAELLLSSEVPDLHVDSALLQMPQIEAHRRDRRDSIVLRHGVHQRRLPRALQSHYAEVQILLPKETRKPIKQLPNPRHLFNSLFAAYFILHAMPFLIPS